VTRVRITPRAQRQLGHLIATRSLPHDTPERVAGSVAPLATHPRIGRGLRGTRAGYRYVRGPWRWIAIVYRYDAANDRVDIVAIQDTRTADAWTADR
jgi:plasmid stabilization system protein ParE